MAYGFPAGAAPAEARGGQEMVHNPQMLMRVIQDQMPNYE
jgi:hypothetical protein